MITPATAEQTATVLEHVGIIRRTIWSFRFTFPGWTLEDLEQEAMIAALHAVQTHDPERGANMCSHVRQYVHQRMLNIFQTERRAKRDRRREVSADLGVGEDGETPLHELVATVPATQLTELEAHEERVRIMRAFESLSPADRVLLRRRFVDDATLTEVAEERGCSREWVRLEQVRALKLLRARYDKTG